MELEDRFAFDYHEKSDILKVYFDNFVIGEITCGDRGFAQVTANNVQASFIQGYLFAINEIERLNVQLNEFNITGIKTPDED